MYLMRNTNTHETREIPASFDARSESRSFGLRGCRRCRGQELIRIWDANCLTSRPSLGCFWVVPSIGAFGIAACVGGLPPAVDLSGTDATAPGTDGSSGGLDPTTPPTDGSTPTDSSSKVDSAVPTGSTTT